MENKKIVNSSLRGKICETFKDKETDGSVFTTVVALLVMRKIITITVKKDPKLSIT